MSIEVLGAGLGRTGTLSLKFALEKLGFHKCYHMMEVALNPHHSPFWHQAWLGEQVDWADVYEGYRATVDWPSSSFWHELHVRYPQAKVILTQRDPEAWYRSVKQTIWKSSQGAVAKARASADPQALARAKMIHAVIWDGFFDGRMDDKAYVIGCFNRHNQAVRDTVPSEQLLVLEPGEGWAPLCRFLACPIPDEAYPKVNSTEDFQRLWGSLRPNK